jgi:hypothetical protein
MISVIISSALEDDVLAVKGCKALGLFDERTYTPYECAHTFAPARTMEEIRKFIGALMTFFDGCAIEVLVYGFCLFSRLTRVMGKSVMNQWRWRLSLLACFMEAHKLLEDKPYSNAMFLRMWKRAKSVSVQGPGILLRELNDMESTLLKLLYVCRRARMRRGLTTASPARLNTLFLDLAPWPPAAAGMAARDAAQQQERCIIDDDFGKMLLAHSPASSSQSSDVCSACTTPQRSSSCPPAQIELWG